VFKIDRYIKQNNDGKSMGGLIEIAKELQGVPVRPAYNGIDYFTHRELSKRELLAIEIYRKISPHEDIKLDYNPAGNDTHFFKRNAGLSVNLTDLQNLSFEYKSQLLAEDTLLQIFDLEPYDFAKIFSDEGGELKLADFSKAFQGYHRDVGPTTITYGEFLEEVMNNLPINVLKNEISEKIRGRIKDNRRELTRILEAAKNEGPPVDNYAKRLEVNLTRFGYIPKE